MTKMISLELHPLYWQSLSWLSYHTTNNLISFKWKIVRWGKTWGEKDINLGINRRLRARGNSRDAQEASSREPKRYQASESNEKKPEKVRDKIFWTHHQSANEKKGVVEEEEVSRYESEVWDNMTERINMKWEKMHVVFGSTTHSNGGKGWEETINTNYKQQQENQNQNQNATQRNPDITNTITIPDAQESRQVVAQSRIDSEVQDTRN